jgi:hypothetical protein
LQVSQKRRHLRPAHLPRQLREQLPRGAAPEAREEARPLLRLDEGEQLAPVVRAGERVAQTEHFFDEAREVHVRAEARLGAQQQQVAAGHVARARVARREGARGEERSQTAHPALRRAGKTEARTRREQARADYRLDLGVGER